MTIDRKRRARRIAADEAHAWARNLRLNNHHAKNVLRSLTLYVDGDGYCYVRIDQLADDCELSADTVRRRLQWLEEIGAIARVPQWIDARGVRNSDERGRRTTDLIRLHMDADEGEIEARARGEAVEETSIESTSISPSRQQGLNPAEGSVSPALALGQPSHSGEGLISEPEPEPDSPQTPLRGAESENAVALEEPGLFAEAWAAWPGHEVMRRDLALDEFRKLSPDQRRHCRAAIPHFVKLQTLYKRTTTPNFHLWIRNRGFEEFPSAATETGASVSSASYSVDSPEGLAIKALFGFARTALFENRGFVLYPLEVTPQVMAFGSLPPESAWHWIDVEDRNQIAAWSHFLSSHIHKPRPELVRQHPQGKGMFAPWPWPPRKDGSTEDHQGAA